MALGCDDHMTKQPPAGPVHLPEFGALERVSFSSFSGDYEKAELVIV